CNSQRPLAFADALAIVPVPKTGKSVKRKKRGKDDPHSEIRNSKFEVRNRKSIFISHFESGNWGFELVQSTFLHPACGLRFRSSDADRRRGRTISRKTSTKGRA